MIGPVLRTFLLLATFSVVVSAFLARSSHNPLGMAATSRFINRGLDHQMKKHHHHIITRLTATRGGVAGNVKEVKTLEETEEVLASAGDKLVVLDFTATWCGPCKMIAPTFEALSEEMTDAIFLKVDVDVNADTAKKFDVYQMPTFCFVKNGEVQGRLVGANPDKLREAVQRFL